MSDKKIMQTVLDQLSLLTVTVDGLGSKLDGLDKKVDGLDKKVDGLDKKVDGLDKRVIKMDVKVEALDAKTDRIQESVNENTTRLDKLGKQLVYLEDDTSTREEFDELEGRVEKLEGGFAGR